MPKKIRSVRKQRRQPRSDSWLLDGVRAVLPHIHTSFTLEQRDALDLLLHKIAWKAAVVCDIIGVSERTQDLLRGAEELAEEIGVIVDEIEELCVAAQRVKPHQPLRPGERRSVKRAGAQ